MSKTILAASDLSEASDEVLRQAHARAVATGADLAVCHALPHLLGVNALFPHQNVSSSIDLADLEGEIRTALDEQLASCLPGVKTTVFLERGNAYAAIVQRAESLAADLVVVGSRGRTGLPRLLLGSVAEQVVRHAHCPVLVARPIATPGVVLVATDLSDPSMPAIAAGAEEAKRRKARLVVVHAIEFGSVAVTIEEIVKDLTRRGSRGNIDEQLRTTADAQMQAALAQCGAQAESRVVDGVAAAAVVRVADELEAELVVIGTRGRTGLVRVALGSTAERIVRTAACSVLCVRLGG